MSTSTNMKPNATETTYEQYCFYFSNLYRLAKSSKPSCDERPMTAEEITTVLQLPNEFANYLEKNPLNEEDPLLVLHFPIHQQGPQQELTSLVWFNNFQINSSGLQDLASQRAVINALVWFNYFQIYLILQATAPNVIQLGDFGNIFKFANKDDLYATRDALRVSIPWAFYSIDIPTLYLTPDGHHHQHPNYQTIHTKMIVYYIATEATNRMILDRYEFFKL